MKEEMTETASQPNPNESVFGYFYGHDMPTEVADSLFAALPKQIKADEAQAQAASWFDYRTLHPTTATYLLASQYRKAYQDCLVVTFDQSGQFMQGFKGADFSESRERLSFWRLRQKIDVMGIRYDFFLRHAMNWHIANGWLRPPRPSHISSNDEMAADIAIKWEDECAIRIQFAKSPFYKTKNFTGHPNQLAYEDFIAAQIASRRYPQYGLAAALYIEDAIRIERAIQEFSTEVVQGAVEEGASYISQS
jgi:hypothetical protein